MLNCWNVGMRAVTSLISRSLVRAWIMGVVFCLPCWGASAQSVYRLQPGDALQLWLAQEPNVTREVVIAPDGWMSFPLAGHIRASGLSLPEVEQQLTDRLKTYFTDKPNLTVMLRPNPQHQPLIYVIGEVTTPGEYPFRPNMTILHGVSVAGGIYRATLLPADQDRSILVRRDVEQMQARLAMLKARSVRLQAEIRGERSIIVGDATNVSPELEQEQSLLTSRMEAVDMSEKAQNQADTMTERTISALRDQAETLSKRVGLAKQRLQSISNLVAKGGAESSQQSAQEGVVAELEGQVSRLKSEMMMAERDRMADQASYDSANKQRSTALLVELNQARQEHEDAEARLADSLGILDIYGNNASMVEQSRTRAIRYVIVRHVEDRIEELAATEMTAIMPGDLIRVSYHLSPQEQQQPASSMSATPQENPQIRLSYTDR